MIINPWKKGSRGAYAVRDCLREMKVPCFTLQREPNTKTALIVNWGNSAFDYETKGRTVVNDPFQVSAMTNKVNFFENTQHSKDVLEWTRNRDKALDWNSVVFARTKVEASGGAGIIVWNPEEVLHHGDLPHAPLYTKYVPKTHEYRLHMARSLRGTGFTVMLAQRKVFVKTLQRPAPLDWKVRSHDNGFIFQSQPNFEKVPVAVMDSAGRVMSEHFPNLHFCALDVMYHDKRDKAWVIEGNTAPGLENNSVSVYAEYFRALEKEHKNVR